MERIQGRDNVILFPSAEKRSGEGVYERDKKRISSILEEAYTVWRTKMHTEGYSTQITAKVQAVLTRILHLFVGEQFNSPKDPAHQQNEREALIDAAERIIAAEFTTAEGLPKMYATFVETLVKVYDAEIPYTEVLQEEPPSQDE